MTIATEMEPAGKDVEPDLRRIHHPAFTCPGEIAEMLEDAKKAQTEFQGGLGPQLDRERAQLETVGPDRLTFSVRNFDLDRRERVVLTFPSGGELYLIRVALLGAHERSGTVQVSLPSCVFRVERRDRERRAGGIRGETPSRVRLHWRKIALGEGRVIDYSGDGIALEVPTELSAGLRQRVELSFADGPGAGRVHAGIVRRRMHRSSNIDEVGLSISAAPPGPLLPVEMRAKVVPRSARGEVRDRLRVGASSAGVAASRAFRRLVPGSGRLPSVDVVRFDNAEGEEIVALRDSWKPQRGATCVVIPPAWAKTKETLLPLARTIVASFAKARMPVVVFRLDGIRRRGESHNDPENRVPGKECHAMTFSQGVRDIRSALDFLSRSPEYSESKVVLVTFSGASIEARRVLADETGNRVCGWVSVVGAADLHGGLRVVSGGQDFIGGFDRGARFGVQRILGIETDIDLVCKDALENRLAYMEDARCQMARVTTPVTWIQGQHDAWIDAQKVREIMSCGSRQGRRLVNVPTGHQLRTSKEALDVFQLVASEVGRFASGKSLKPVLPDLVDVDRRRVSERKRISNQTIDLKSFWHDYLLGHDELPGMEVLTATRDYRSLMAAQAKQLDLRPGSRVADVGAGIGTFSLFLASDSYPITDVEVHQYDFLREALRYGRNRLAATELGPNVQSVVCDFAPSSGAVTIPTRSESYDAVIASLLLNYIPKPAALLGELRRVLRPGGRLVVSALRRDTDISRIYVDAATEIQTGRLNLGSDFPAEALDAAIRSFLNEAARLVDLEERGVFTFWDPGDLSSLIRSAGLEVQDVQKSFGEPAQAIVVFATAPL